MRIEILQEVQPSGLGLQIAARERPRALDPVVEENPARWVIRQNPKTGDRTIEMLSWGFVHGWSEVPEMRRPKTTKAEGVPTSPFFGDAYRRRRCLVPVTAFIEIKRSWKRTIESCLVTMDTKEFALGGVWETWSHPSSWQRLTTFALITTPANALIRPVAERMPLIISSTDYDRWLSRLEFNPSDLLVPFPSQDMRMRRVFSSGQVKQRW